MIVQNVSHDGATDITFTVNRNDAARAREILDSLVKEIGAEDVLTNDGLAKLSIVGIGMRSHAGVAAKMFRLLADEGINIHSITTSEIKISVLIADKYGELATRVLHDSFGLEHGASPGDIDL
jgi:aspartate kinase